MIFGKQVDHFCLLSGWLKNLQCGRVTGSVSCPVLYNKIERAKSHLFKSAHFIIYFIFKEPNYCSKPSYFKITMGLLLNSLYEGLS